jgi:hypothetical protein
MASLPEGINLNFHCHEYFMLRESNNAKTVTAVFKSYKISASCKHMTEYRIDL